MTVWWLTNFPVDLGELSLCADWDFLNPRVVYSSFSVSEKDIIRNRKSNGYMMYPCLARTLKSMDVLILRMMSLATLLIAEHSLGGAPYFTSMAMINAWLEVSKSLNRYENSTHVGRFWLFIRYRSVLIVNVPS